MTTRTSARSALLAALCAAPLCVATDSATAASTANVQAGTLKVTGDSASDKLTLRLQPGLPTILQVDVGDDGTADFLFDRSTFTAIHVQAGSGDDTVRVDHNGGTFSDEDLTVDGGAGNDRLHGGSGADALLGGRGNDVVTGGDGDDRALLGDGTDLFEWNPGDDSDLVEGQAGTDLLDFNGANVAENIGVSVNGSRVLLTRDVATVSMDLDEVERIGLHPAGGADRVVVDSLAATDVKHVDVDLGAAGDGGDAQIDTVVATGTDAADSVSVGAVTGGVRVSGLAAQVQVTGAESTLDDVDLTTLGGADTVTTGVGVSGPASINVDGGAGQDSARYNGTAAADAIDLFANGTEVSTVAPATTRLDITAVERQVVSGLAGADTITSVGNVAPLTALTIDGGDGGDTLRGGNGADVLIGGAGNDSIDGNQGADRTLLGGGEDRFQWDPGDGSDTVEGGSGDDALDFNGNGATENVAVSANGARARITRDVGGIVLDVNDIEDVGLRVAGGTDTITVGDLTGTDVTTADVDLNAVGGGGDLLPDTVIANGTSRRDVVGVTAFGSQVVASGLAARTRITGSEATNDTLRVQTLAGNDEVTVAPDVFGLITPVVDLGADE